MYINTQFIYTVPHCHAASPLRSCSYTVTRYAQVKSTGSVDPIIHRVGLP